jgi:hypothetical protein
VELGDAHLTSLYQECLSALVWLEQSSSSTSVRSSTKQFKLMPRSQSLNLTSSNGYSAPSTSPYVSGSSSFSSMSMSMSMSSASTSNSLAAITTANTNMNKELTSGQYVAGNNAASSNVSHVPVGSGIHTPTVYNANLAASSLSTFSASPSNVTIGSNFHNAFLASTQSSDTSSSLNFSASASTSNKMSARISTKGGPSYSSSNNSAESNNNCQGFSLKSPETESKDNVQPENLHDVASPGEAAASMPLSIGKSTHSTRSTTSTVNSLNMSEHSHVSDAVSSVSSNGVDTAGGAANHFSTKDPSPNAAATPSQTSPRTDTVYGQAPAHAASNAGPSIIPQNLQRRLEQRHGSYYRSDVTSVFNSRFTMGTAGTHGNIVPGPVVSPDVTGSSGNHSEAHLLIKPFSDYSKRNGEDSPFACLSNVSGAVDSNGNNNSNNVSNNGNASAPPSLDPQTAAFIQNVKKVDISIALSQVLQLKGKSAEAVDVVTKLVADLHINFANQQSNSCPPSPLVGYAGSASPFVPQVQQSPAPPPPQQQQLYHHHHQQQQSNTQQMLSTFASLSPGDMAAARNAGWASLFAKCCRRLGYVAHT